MLVVVGWCGWWSVRWSVMERESEVTTRISHPLFQQVARTVMRGMWTGPGSGSAACTSHTVRDQVERKQQVDHD